MKCFQHQQADAVAVCCACGRAVCAECSLVPDGRHIVCSAECRADDASTIASRVAALELLLATARSYKGLALAFKLLAGVMFLFAVLLPWLPAPSFIYDEDLAVWQLTNYGAAALIALLGIICIVCSRFVAKASGRHDELVKQLPD